MTIPAAKVRTLCTPAEVAIVRASRKPELEQLSQAEVKRMAVRARKLVDKWKDLGRSQSRTVTRKVGAGAVEANTAIKAEIFRDALSNFEAKLAKFEGKVGGKTKPKTKPKKVRAVDHRASRAAVRKGMSAVEDLLNISKRKK